MRKLLVLLLRVEGRRLYHMSRMRFPSACMYLRGYGGEYVLCRLLPLLGLPLPLQLLVRALGQVEPPLPTTSRPHLQNAICITCKVPEKSP